MTTEEFEKKCMDVIGEIIAKDNRYKRTDALKRAEKMLELVKQKTDNANIISIYERVVSEFKIATDQEYELLKKQIFSED